MDEKKLQNFIFLAQAIDHSYLSRMWGGGVHVPRTSLYQLSRRASRKTNSCFQHVSLKYVILFQSRGWYSWRGQPQGGQGKEPLVCNWRSQSCSFWSNQSSNFFRASSKVELGCHSGAARWSRAGESKYLPENKLEINCEKGNTVWVDLVVSSQQCMPVFLLPSECWEQSTCSCKSPSKIISFGRNKDHL